MRTDSNTLNGRLKMAALVLLSFAVTLPALAQEEVPGAEDQNNRVVLVSLVDRQLAVIQDGIVMATFRVAVGAAVSPSPTGEFKVVSRVQNPTYYHPGIVIPTGKSNPIGTRWLGLSQKGYGIHGTNAPRSIGRAASHGCIRLRNRDMEKLFTMVRVGDTVRIRSERDEEVVRIFGGKAEQTLLAEVPAAMGSGGQ